MIAMVISSDIGIAIICALFAILCVWLELNGTFDKIRRDTFNREHGLICPKCKETDTKRTHAQDSNPLNVHWCNKCDKCYIFNSRTKTCS